MTTQAPQAKAEKPALAEKIAALKNRIVNDQSPHNCSNRARWAVDEAVAICQADHSAAVRDAREGAVTDMLDRILASAQTMTRTMLIDWLKIERSALRDTPQAEQGDAK